MTTETTEPIAPIETKSVSLSDLEDLKLLLADALLTEQNYQSGAMDLTESQSLLSQAVAQTDPNLAMMFGTIASLTSSNEVLKSSNAGLTQQISLKDQAVARALTILERILPT